MMHFLQLNSSTMLVLHGRSPRVNLMGRKSQFPEGFLFALVYLIPGHSVSHFLRTCFLVFCCRCHVPTHSSEGTRGKRGAWAGALQCPDGFLVQFLLLRNRRFTIWPFYPLVFRAPLTLCGSTYRTISIKTTRSTCKTIIYRSMTSWLSTTAPIQVSGGCLKVRTPGDSLSSV